MFADSANDHWLSCDVVDYMYRDIIGREDYLPPPPSGNLPPPPMRGAPQERETAEERAERRRRDEIRGVRLF